MQNKCSYEFVVIRLVPKVEREEFINVGVIVFSKPRKYLDIKYQLDRDRLLGFAPDLDLELLEQHLQAWEAICAGQATGGPIGAQELPYRFRWLAANRSTILQTSAVHPGICTEPGSVLDDLFERYVN